MARWLRDPNPMTIRIIRMSNARKTTIPNIKKPLAKTHQAILISRGQYQVVVRTSLRGKGKFLSSKELPKQCNISSKEERTLSLSCRSSMTARGLRVARLN
ncbi:hypothetical protein COLO4_11293 [Corchorus olitorius]|uniref:Uncharacterized protein n=1 Tax=Corchorus olitorius TaxID=93759 RepID=A0A1R3K509_9ROSI|nr:hypothetical protein COLO4_11293 [Corchorus olitorius]